MMKRKLPREFRLQQDPPDGGVVCLWNILNYYRVDLSTERLSEWSGCGRHGATLPGLHQAAEAAGFRARGMKAGYIADLREVPSPCILPVTMDGTTLHYVVFYPGGRGRREAGIGGGTGTGGGTGIGGGTGTCWHVGTGGRNHVKVGTRRRRPGDNRLLIGDPARGLVWMEAWQLEEIWPSQAVLLLEPGERLSRWRRQRNKKIGWVWQTLMRVVKMLIATAGSARP